MQTKEIRDYETLEAWLKGRDQHDSILIATRAALRVAPLWFAAMNERWASKRDLTSLPVLRSLLISSVACKYPTDDIRIAANAAAANAAAAYATAAAYAAATTADAATYAAAAAATGTPAATTAAADAATAASIAAAATTAAWTILREECERLEAGQPFDGFALWHGGENPALAEWAKTQTLWADPQGPYAFWLRWYTAALQGNHLNLPLEHDIASIPDEDWQKGPDHIAAIIADIEERHALRAEVIALREQLRQSQAQAASVVQRSHNNPPELIDAAPEAQRQITIIFDTLDKAEAELPLAKPSPSRLQIIGQALLAAGLAIEKYCGGLADTALQKAAEELGTTGTKWAVRAVALSFAAQPVQTLGQKLIEYALKLAQVANFSP